DHLQKQAGELQQLTERRQELPHWLDLTPLEQQYISESFGDIADARSRARHPTNLTVWATAARAEAGTREAIGNDVDPSLLLVTNALEQALIARRSELRHSQIINFTRTIRFNTWYIEEDRVLSAADRYLRDLLDHQDKETLAELRHRARLLRFHVQPLNQLAYRLQSSGGQPAANDVLETARAGMQFQRMHLYLRRPFAQLARAPLKTLGGSALDPLMAALNARGAVLESLDIGGSYRQLIGRLLGETAATKAAIERRDVRTAKRTAAHFNRLLSRYCLPHEPAVQEWYGYQL
ncbi:MAG TPA: hypothetical protein VFN56_01470, partial [Candidatus Saccharimonadales bacterium]|nr:hypothetical protein [Candidatus Saccharimonadales bacterium]